MNAEQYDGEDVIIEAQTYSIFQVEIEIDGNKEVVKSWAGKWNTYYDFTGDTNEVKRRNRLVRAALAKEIIARQDKGQSPDYTDREV